MQRKEISEKSPAEKFRAELKERKAFYWNRRKEKFESAKKAFDVAIGNERFFEAYLQIGKYVEKRARAYIRGDRVSERIYAMKMQSYRQELKKALQEVGLTLQDLKYYTCEKCKDMGINKDGILCDCYSC